MGFYNNLCPGCMNEVGEAEKCPYCGFNLTSEQEAPFLPYGTVIAGKYVVGDVLEQNSEGVTYIGMDTITNTCVRIREFLPYEICSRAKGELKIAEKENFEISYGKYRSEFISLWHKIMKLRNNESIISVLDVFEANNTAYAIAEADGSKTLSEYIEENGGILKWDTVSSMILPAADAIEELNKAGVIHGCISPDTLFLCSNGKFKPWGFSISEVRKADGTLETDINPGYAAYEQYGNDLELSEATDVYGLCATLYKCMVGSVPIDAQTRSKEDTLSIPADKAREMPDYIVASFICGLQVASENRIPNITELKSSFTKEGYARQKKLRESIQTTLLVDPLSDIKPTDNKLDTPTTTVVSSSKPAIPVLKKDAAAAKKNSTATTLLLCLSVMFVMIIFFVCLGLTGIVSFNIGSGQTAKVITMPDFTNRMKTDEAIVEAANEYGLHITLKAESSEAQENLIFAQSVAPGTKIAVGSEVTLSYSIGATTVTLPNFMGMSVTESVYYLGKLDLSYNIVQKENPGNQTAGTVASMDPAPNSIIYTKSEITLEVWGEAKSASGNADSGSGSEISSSGSIIDNIVGRLSDSVSGLGSTIQNFFN